MSADKSSGGMLSPPLGWSGDEVRIARTFKFASFPQAIAFMVEVSFFCEGADHHPEWRNVYDRVSVELTTHDAGRLTEKDLELARHMDAVYARLAGGVPGSSH
jgi:4a-hydroxytetrahydrobiopterin dehydratase